MEPVQTLVMQNQCSDVGPVMFPVLKSDETGTSTECSDVGPVHSVVMRNKLCSLF